MAECRKKICSKNKQGGKKLTGHLMFNLLKPTGYGMHQQVEYFKNSTLCPYCIYVLCICLRTNSEIVSFTA
jgi:hypothetical protein